MIIIIIIIIIITIIIIINNNAQPSWVTTRRQVSSIIDSAGHGGSTTCTCAWMSTRSPCLLSWGGCSLSRWSPHGPGKPAERAGHIQHTAAAPVCCRRIAQITPAHPSVMLIFTGLLLLFYFSLQQIIKAARCKLHLNPLSEKHL